MVRRGFTLIELMVGIALGSLIVMAAVGFAGHQVTTLGRSNQTLEMTQVESEGLDAGFSFRSSALPCTLPG